MVIEVRLLPKSSATNCAAVGAMKAVYVTPMSYECCLTLVLFVAVCTFGLYYAMWISYVMAYYIVIEIQRCTNFWSSVWYFVMSITSWDPTYRFSYLALTMVAGDTSFSNRSPQ